MRPLTNLLIPFRRDKKHDFAIASGGMLLGSKVRQVLLTEGSTPRSSGELPWRTNFGAGLGLLRHRSVGNGMRELARVRVRDAIHRWLPGVTVLRIDVEATEDLLTVRVRTSDGEAVATATTGQVSRNGTEV